MLTSIQVLPLQKTISAAWHNVRGSKKVYFLTNIFYYTISGLAFFALMIRSPLGSILHAAFIVSLNLIGFGMLKIGINRAFNLPIGFRNIFCAFEANYTWRLIGILIIEVLLCLIIFLPYAIIDGIMKYYHPQNTFFSHVFLVLGIAMCAYFLIRMMLAQAFVLHQKSGPIDAIRLSLVATRKNFWRLVILINVQILLFMFSLLTAGIGLIWAFPLMINIYGEIYKNLLINVPPGLHHR